jgi:extradiol dioxygenase family protein
MLKVIELAFCCCAVTDVARARAFCGGVLNLKPALICRRAMIFDPDGNTICIHKCNAK